MTNTHINRGGNARVSRLLDKAENAKWIAALLREREAYVQANKPERVKQVDRELERYGYTAHKSEAELRKAAPQGRSERPPQVTPK